MGARTVRRALPVAALLTAVLAAPAAADVINGTPGPDNLVGTARADTMHGFQGDDLLHGKGGGDRLYGGRGADRVYGDTGGDQVYGGRDQRQDRLYGGAGADRLYARWHDRVFAGPGSDRVRIVSTEGATMQLGLVIWCGPGFDQVVGGSKALWGWAFIQAHGCERIHPST